MSNNPDEMSRPLILWRLFVEFFKLSLFVIGGGYAIIVAADDVFARKLKWFREGELIERLPILQSVPGLIAGNTAIFLGMKMAGVLGAFVSLVAAAIPSLVIITGIAMGFQWLPLGNAYVNGAFLGLRSALCGIVFAALLKSWKKTVRGAYGYIMLPVFFISMVVYEVSPVYVLVGSILFGVIYMGIVLPKLRPHAIDGEENGL